MGHGPCTFKKRDVKTAVQGAREGGIEVARVVIEKDGKIIIVAGKPVDGDKAEPNEWDENYGED